MTKLVNPTDIERIVGARRHPREHLGRAVSADATVYILHSQECVETDRDLRDCDFSRALDRGIDQRPYSSIWARRADRTVRLMIHDGRLVPRPGWTDFAAGIEHIPTTKEAQP